MTSRPGDNSLYDEADAWGTAPSGGGEEVDEGKLLQEALQKEAVIKDILQARENLRALLGRVKTVQDECAKRKEENAVLQTYIDNLTRHQLMVAEAGRK